MTDEQKTREQLLSELRDLRREVERLRSPETDPASARWGLDSETLERRVTEHFGWL
jgi:hypothetical protein